MWGCWFSWEKRECEGVGLTGKGGSVGVLV
jgi:hypothetical protein